MSISSPLLFDQQALSLGSGSLSLGGGSLGALSETVLSSSKHMFQVSHSAGSLGVSPLSLDGPVVYIDDGEITRESRSLHLLLVAPG